MGLLQPSRRPLSLPRKGRAVALDLPRLEDLAVGGKRVLIRADLNVPRDDGRIADDFRIRAFLPTLEKILERGGTAVVCSHLGRPKGPDPKYTLAPVAAALSEALAGDVPLVDDYESVPQARVVLLENLRFHPGETKNDPSFVQTLCGLADAYVNDAFGSCHRGHASIIGPPARLPSAAGPLLRSEIDNLSKLLEAPARPYVVVLGGVKVSDKIGVVRNLIDRADEILIGGAMCFTFVKASGGEIGRSLLDEEHLNDVSDLLDSERANRVRIPIDAVCAESIESVEGRVVPAGEIPEDLMGVDIGPETSAAFADAISRAATVFWNGPMGVFENAAFAQGSRAVAEAVASCTGYTATGGGDTAAVLSTFGFEDAVDFASTGGGASLEFLEGKTLPGIAALAKET